MKILVRLRTLALAAVLVLAVAAPASAARHQPAKQKAANPNTGIVSIFTTLGYQNGEAAGTGMIVSSSGEVLTNNHVIRGATAFRVVEASTRRTYTATVVGYSVSEDVAMLQIENAKTLKPIPLGNSSNTRIGMPVVARGNAGGRGCCTVARGVLTALHRQITAADETGNTETLQNLLETNAGIEPGDSGGPLFNAKGRVVGMVTAGTTSFRFQQTASRGYAIRINRALTLLRQIRAGVSTDTVHVGPTAFLGVLIQDRPGGVLVSSLVPGGAAEAAGLTPGSTLTSLDGRAVTTSDELRAVVLTLVPGTAVPIEWTDAAGVAHSGQITPAAGPPQ